MTDKVTRRGFLSRALLAAGGAALVLLGAAGRAMASAARRIRVPAKPLRHEELRKPHDLAG